jgi:hypothetical protein
MIRPPQRSVTRFFIPLLDVLTLLFCVFLLMPMYKRSDAEKEKKIDTLTTRIRKLEQDVREKDRRIASLSKAPTEALQARLAPHVLELDPTNGHLLARDPDSAQPRDLTEKDVRDLIERDRRRLGDGKQLAYIIYLRDRSTSLFPTKEQSEMYRRWFNKVPLLFDTEGRK